MVYLGGPSHNMEVSGTSMVLVSGVSSGFYETQAIDMGFSARAKALLKVVTAQVGDDDPVWDDCAWTWDSETGQSRTWDGPVGLDALTVTVEAKYATSYANLVTAAWKTYVPEERTFRWCKFKVTLTVTDSNFSASLDDLFINLEAVQIINKKENLTVPANSNPLAVTFDTPFADAGTVSLVVQLLATNLVSGDYVDVQDITTTGFNLRVRDSADAIIAGGARYVSYHAIGF